MVWGVDLVGPVALLTKKEGPQWRRAFFVPPSGVDPLTFRFSVERSTN